jgi:hypothetical protein
MRDEQLPLRAGDLLHREAHSGYRHVDDEVDAIGIVPLPRDLGADVGLELVIGGDHLDRLAADLAAEILDRHLGRDDRPLAGRVRRRTREVGEHTDPDDVVGELSGRGMEPAEQRHTAEQRQGPQSLHARRLLPCGVHAAHPFRTTTTQRPCAF